ncbi:MAG: ABC transporter ATP-binding protein [Deltaproteobacteria bacterium]
MIQLDSVRKVFNEGKPNECIAVHGESAVIDLNRATALTGPSGSGKTTLLTLIGCLARPTAGRIRLNDREITSLPERFLTQIRQSTFGFIFQKSNLIGGLTVLENVMLPAYPTGEKHSLLQRRALALLEAFKIAGKAKASAQWLSGGEAQRVAICRALINNPSIIIADEPTANLDSKLSVDFMDMMDKLKSEQKTIIIASHDPLVYRSSVINTVIAMRDGRIEEAPAV